MAQSSQYTEEMLLDSPTMDTQAATEPVQEPRGSGERQNVSPSEMLMKDSLIKNIHKGLVLVAVECEKILSQSLRTTDPLRNRVMEALKHQVRLTEETVKSEIEEFVAQTSENNDSLVDCTNVVEVGVLEILRSANLTRADQLEACLDDKLADRETIAKVCEITDCDRMEVEMRVKELVVRLEHHCSFIEAY